MNAELKKILERFAGSGWGMIADPSLGWLRGKVKREALEAAIRDAYAQCGSCGCDFDLLYPRALELLRDEPEGYVYEKLVRDRIPEMIRAHGERPCTRVLGEEEYFSELHRKLREEIEEYIESGSMEEIADILEVLEAICAAKGFAPEAVLECKKAKKEKRGGFEKRIYLISKE